MITKKQKNCNYSEPTVFCIILTSFFIFRIYGAQILTATVPPAFAGAHCRLRRQLKGFWHGLSFFVKFPSFYRALQSFTAPIATERPEKPERRKPERFWGLAERAGQKNLQKAEWKMYFFEENCAAELKKTFYWRLFFIFMLNFHLEFGGFYV